MNYIKLKEPILIIRSDKLTFDQLFKCLSIKYVKQQELASKTVTGLMAFLSVLSRVEVSLLFYVCIFDKRETAHQHQRLDSSHSLLNNIHSLHHHH